MRGSEPAQIDAELRQIARMTCGVETGRRLGDAALSCPRLVAAQAATPTNAGAARRVRRRAPRERAGVGPTALGVARARGEVEQAGRAPDVERLGEIGTEVVAAGGQTLEGLEVPVASVTWHEAQRTLRSGVLPHVSAHRTPPRIVSLVTTTEEPPGNRAERHRRPRADVSPQLEPPHSNQRSSCRWTCRPHPAVLPDLTGREGHASHRGPGSSRSAALPTRTSGNAAVRRQSLRHRSAGRPGCGP